MVSVHGLFHNQPHRDGIEFGAARSAALYMVYYVYNQTAILVSYPLVI